MRQARAAPSNASWSISIRAARAWSHWKSHPSASGVNGTFSATSGHLPTAGEIVLFDRSWYNRAGVERVMGFCTPREYDEFMQQVPAFERHLSRRAARSVIKLWFSVSRAEQRRRFREREMIIRSSSGSLSPVDLASLDKWDAVHRSQGSDVQRTPIPPTRPGPS